MDCGQTQWGGGPGAVIFEVRCLDKNVWRTARGLPTADFEDAVVASLGLGLGAALIITRNVSDFSNAPIQAVSPANFLSGQSAFLQKGRT